MTYEPGDRAIEAAARALFCEQNSIMHDHDDCWKAEKQIRGNVWRDCARAALIAAYGTYGFRSIEELNAASVEERQDSLIYQQIDELVTMGGQLDLLTDAMRFIAESVSSAPTPEDTAEKFRVVARTALGKLNEDGSAQIDRDEKYGSETK